MHNSNMDKNIQGKPIKRIAIISDPQIDCKSNNFFNECELLKTCFHNMDVEALAVCGDITENGLPEEWNTFFDIFDKYCQTKILFLVPGNMDNTYNAKGKKVFLDIYQKRFFI